MSRRPVDDDSIAVLGLACRFPGAPDVASFWRNLRGGVEALVRFTEAELLASGIDRRWFSHPRYVPAGMVLADVETFDAGFFALGDGEAAALDPQQRLLLECAWEALEDAGHPPGTGDHRVGVYAGARLSDYLHGRQPPIDLFGHGPEPPALHFQRLLANDKDYVASRLAFALDLRGPAVSVQTACSTSLVAVHLACQSLLEGECDLALAGGASVRLPQRAGYLWSEGMIYSPDGHTRTFDARAAGTVFGSGAGMVALRRLPDALADGDRILAVLRGSAVNNDGGSDKASFAAPSPRGQAEVVAAALAAAGLEPADLSYLEAHGTATPIGDAIEIAALNEVFRRSGRPPGTCAIGSVKSNVGHLVQAAGVAGLIKTVLMLHHRELVPSLNFERPNPEAGLAGSPFAVATSCRPWDDGDRPRRAGVGSYGFGGTNAYVVLEEHVGAEAPPEPAAPRLLTLSAKTPQALRDLVDRTAAALAGSDGGALADACFTSQVGRRHFAHRRAVVATVGEDLLERLAERRDEPEPERRPAPPRIAFAFSGQGAATGGAGRGLYATHPGFRHSLERSDELLAPELGRPLAEILFGVEADALLADNALAQPALVALQIALVDLWRAWGIAPDVVLGHSVGELTAAWAAGALGRREVLLLAAGRGRAMQERCAPGAMLAVSAPAETVAELVATASGELVVAAFNGPQRVVLSGSVAACERASAALADRRLAARRLPVSRAFHSPLVEPALDQIERLAAGLEASPPRLAFLSTLTGEAVPGDRVVAAGHWRRHAREPVLFAEALATLAGQAVDLVVEIGPEPALAALAGGDHPAPWIPSLRRGLDDRRQMCLSLATAYEHGAEVDWPGFAESAGLSRPGERRRRAALPTYPFQRRRHWIELPARSSPDAGDERLAAHPLLGRRLPSPPPQVVFQARLSAAGEPFLRDHRIYDGLPMLGTAYVEIALAAAAEIDGEARPTVVEELTIARSLLLDRAPEHLLHTWLEPEGDGGHRLCLSSCADGGAVWQEHARARLGPGSQHRPAAIDRRAIEARCATRLAPDEVVAGQELRGAALGPSLRMVRRVLLGDGELLALAELPAEVRPTAHRYLAHPVLLDACMQLAFLVHPPANPGGELFLPTVIERLSWHGRLPERVWCHLRSASAIGGEVYAIDFDVADEAGRVLVAAQGVCFKRARRSAMERGPRQEEAGHLLRHVHWQPAGGGPQVPAVPAAGAWWLCGGGDLASRLARRLEAAGGRVVLVGEPELADAASRERLLADADRRDGTGLALAGAVHLEAAEMPAADGDDALADPQRAARLAAGALALARLLAEQRERPGAGTGAGLWLVTRGAQRTGCEAGPIVPAAAALWGLGRVIQQEEPELSCRLLDLDPSGTDPDEELLVAELGAPSAPPLLAMRHGRRLLPALRAAPRELVASGRPAGALPARPLAVVAGRERSIEGITLASCERRPPEAGEVEIRVLASGLNFRDALNASGRLRGPLGWECSGLVVAAGAGVADLVPGDAVVALVPDCLRELVTVDARRVAAKPSHLGFAAAAAVPAAFLTALYALRHLAGLRAGQRVLIHTAAGGVGQAAVQVARQAGAEVFATASRPKWAYLRSLGVASPMDSRVPGFSRQLLARTGGAGVDVVLNTLAGPFVEESLAVVAAGGHFVELGHPDMEVWSVDRLAAARPDVHPHHFRLSEDVAERDPDLLAALFRSLVADLESGALRPLPYRLHPADEVRAALAEQLAARHAGKIVLAWPRSPAAEQQPLRPDATYLVTGGTGALGLRVARRLAEAGARHLVLVSRSAGSRPLPDLGVDGAEARLLAADVAKGSEVEAVLDEIRATLPPLRGVVHAAGILDDGVLRRQSRERLEGVFAPKVTGAFHLHRLTRDLPLDFFVVFSSLAAISGNPGQATYAAANAYLDGLAHLRRSLGLAATSINWGPWGEAGMAAAGGARHRQRRRELSGVRDLAPERALDVLVALLAAESAQVLVAELEGSRLSYGAGPRREATDEATSGLRPPAPTAPAREPTRADVLRLVTAEVASQGGLAPGAVAEGATLRELGLDSLAVLLLRGRILAGLDQRVTTPVATFLGDPTVAKLVDALVGELEGTPGTAPAAAAPDRGAAPGPAAGRADLRRLVAETTAGWRAPWDGHRGLLVRGTQAGGATPLFWCLQGEGEFRALSAALAGHPVWGMRSGHLLMETVVDNIRALAELYAAEVAELAGDGPVVVGGNCQGSVIAFLVAQHLWARGLHVHRLCMLENRVPTVIRDVYPGRVSLLYGTDSDHVYHPFKRFLEPQRGWQRLYPNGYSVDFIPGAHGHFFVPPALDHLARHLQQVLQEADAEAAAREAIAALRHGLLGLAAEVGPPDDGGGVDVRLTLSNRGPRDWSCPAAAGITVGGHWLDGGGEVIAWADGARRLEVTVPAGGAARVDLRLTPPAGASPATLRVGLAEDGVDWLLSADRSWSPEPAPQGVA